jgi:hypothetical protein
MVGDPLSDEEPCGEGGAARQGGRRATVSAAPGHASGPEETTGLPERWSLTVSGSNPATGSVTGVLAAPKPSAVRVAIYDVRGRRVRQLVGGPVGAGFHEWSWDRSSEGGGVVAPGVYFLRVESPEFRQTRKVVLLPAGR